ncbi:hypothetical protein K439DRAFT_1610562 [Ramaria rubella]|nr:hypothetical protein K439DRAFT_1610562 [Ramaria rubella]
MSSLQNLATMATFFSAVTATMIQYSLANNSSGLSEAVNAFWFSSLVLSIASALNGFFAYVEKRKICPSTFLLLSVVSFLAGLGCFAMSSQILVFIFEGMSIFSLAAVLTYSTVDRWKFSRITRNMQQKPTIPKRELIGRPLPTFFRQRLPSLISRPAPEAIDLESEMQHPVKNREGSGSAPDQPSKKGVEHAVILPEPHSPRTTTHAPSISPEQRFRRVVTRIIGTKRALGVATESIRNEELERQLKKVSPTGQQIHLLANGAIGSPDFSPDGTMIAICGYFETLRYELKDTGRQQRLERLDHGVRQVTWSSSSGHILTLCYEGIYVWPQEFKMQKVLYASSELGKVVDGEQAEDPHSEPKFLAIEGQRSRLSLLGMSGHEYMTHVFPHMSIEHVDVIGYLPGMPGCTVILAASVLSCASKRPRQASAVRKLIVFNLTTCEVKWETPLWNPVRQVKVSTQGTTISILVSYQDWPPPQIWSLRHSTTEVSLSLRRQLSAPRPTVKFSGRGQWLNNRSFLLCATTDGEIYFWRFDRDEPVHILTPSDDHNEDKSFDVACKPVGDDFMFATRGQDGVVRIWKTYDPPRSPKPTQAEVTSLEGLEVASEGISSSHP